MSRGSNKQLEGGEENSCLAKRQLAAQGKKQPHIIPLNSHLQKVFVRLLEGM